MNKATLNASVLALTILGAVVCFCLDKYEAGTLLVALAAGHVLPSPVQRRETESTPGLERAEQDERDAG